MGNSIFKRLFPRKDVKVLFIGLDGAGKTTILYRFKYGEARPSTPTVAFNAEVIRLGHIRMTCWDVGLRDKTRDCVKHYLPGTHCLIFVVDSTDTERFDDALTNVLENVCRETEVVDVPVLVLANKQDLEYAMDPNKVRDYIQNNGCLKSRTWEVYGVSAITGNGMKKTLRWLNMTLLKGNKRGEINRSISYASVTEQGVNNDVNSIPENAQSFCFRIISTIRRFLCRK